MKQSFFLIVIFIASTMSCKSQELSVMTYNIRLDISSDGENAWSNRKDFFISQVLFYAPDIMGVQEARPNQVYDLKESLIDYEYFGKGRDGDDNGEHSAIYYNTKKFKVDNISTFWLSETPGEISKSWDAAYPRICTYGLFTDIESKKQIWIFNTHLDHVGVQARLEGMKLIQKKISEVNNNNLPVILMGDFNVEPSNDLIIELKKSMLDTKEHATIIYGPEGTFNAFKYDEPVTRRIDYIMVSKSSSITIDKYGVLNSSIDFKFPSDHFPVFVKFTLE